MNVAFYVSGTAGRVSKILKNENAEVLDSTKLIFSDDNQNKFLGKMIVGNDIEYQCLNFEDIVKTPTESKSMIMSNSLLTDLDKHSIDYCFSFGNHLLVGELLNVYKNRIINFHPSVLPMFPGMKSIDQAVNARAFVLGNTAHFIDAGIDTGPVIMQNVVSTEVFKQRGYDAVLDNQLIMFEQIFNWLKDDRLRIVDGTVQIDGADYGQSAFFPGVEA